MTILYVNTGTSPNKGDGDTLRVAFNKINANFAQVANIINPWFLTSSTGATVVLNDNGPTGGLALNTGTWIQMAGQSGGMVLGTENTEFSDSTSSFIFSWGNAGDMVVTSIESGSGVILSDAFGSAVTVGPVKSTTGLWPGGSAGTVKITAGASTTTSTWIFDELGSLTAPGSIIPNADSLYNLGSPSKQWKDLYVSSGTIWIGGVPLTVNTANSTLVIGTGSTSANLATEEFVRSYSGTGDLQFGGTTIYNSSTVSIETGDPHFWWAEFGNYAQTNTSTFGVGVSHDVDGNLWVYGSVIGDSESASETLALKYDPTGKFIWQVEYKDSEINSGACVSNDVITFDNDGNAYYLANDEENNYTYIGRMDANGNTINQEVFYLNGWAVDMVFDHNNYMCLAGGIYGDGYDIAQVTKVDENYHIIWSVGLDCGSESYGQGLTVDSSGNIYTVVYLQSETATGIIKLDTNGNIIWQNIIDINGAPNAEGWAIGVNDGYLYALAQDRNDGSVLVTKLDLDGNLIWQKSFDIAIEYNVQGYDLNFDSDGNIYVTGPASLPYECIWIAKLEPSAGDIIWQHSLATPDDTTTQNMYWWYGHRQADVYQDRIAVTGFTGYNVQVSTSSETAFVFVAQLPTDGSLLGSYKNIVYSDVTEALSTWTNTATYTISTAGFTTSTVSISGNTGTFSSSTAIINASATLTSFSEHLGIEWTFDSTGTVTFPKHATIHDGTDQFSLLMPSNKDVLIGTNNGTTSTDFVWTFNAAGSITLPNGSAVDDGGAYFGLYAGIPDKNVLIRTNGGANQDWVFNSTGTLTLPNECSIGGGDVSKGIALTTDRGTVLFGNHPEPGAPSHFHIMKDNYGSVDLFFGDDFNFLQLPGYDSDQLGVNIGTNSRYDSATQYNWRFGTDGSTLFPGKINYATTANTISTISNAVEIDLSMSIVKLIPTTGSTGLYHLSDGVEGQFLHIVPANSFDSSEYTGINIDNCRYVNGGGINEGAGNYWLPFYKVSYNGNSGSAVITLIFTNGHWNLPHAAFD